jgi:predicted MFS family arabinose efflux permease
VAFLALLGLAVLDAAGYSMIAPVVPEIARSTGAGPALVGALVTCFAVGQLVGYPLAGRGIRRRHAASVLGAALVLMVVGDLGFILADSLPLYFGSRLLQGIGAGGLWIGITFGLLERYPDDAYRRFTAVLAAYSIGGVAGPALGWIGGIRGPFIAHLVLVAGGAIAVWRMGTPARPAGFGSDRTALREPGFLLASAGILLVALAIGTLEGPLALHFGTQLSQRELSGLYVGISVVVGASAVWAGRLRPRIALAAGTVLISVAVPLAAATSTVAVWLAAGLLFGIGFGVAESGALGILLETIGTSRIVLAMVVWSQLWGIGYLVAPAAGGGLAQALGASAIGLVSLVGALLVVAAFAASRAQAKGD